MDSMKEWMWLVFKSAITAFFTLPFLAFLLIIEKDIKSFISRSWKNLKRIKQKKLTKNEDNIPRVSKKISYDSIFKDIDSKEPKMKYPLQKKFVRNFFYCFPIIAILIYNSRNESVGLIVSIFFATILSGFASLLIVCALETEEAKTLKQKVESYFKRLLHPLYLFPIKLVTYSLYYLSKLILGFVVSMLKAIWGFISFPFRSVKNLFKSVFVLILIFYIPLSMMVNFMYVKDNYGWFGKFFKCSIGRYGADEKVKQSIVRVVGGYSEGSGFFFAPNQIMTNFHVIAGEPSPKIIFSDGSFVTPKEIIGDADADLAIIFTEKDYPEMVLETITEKLGLFENEKLTATGYPMGTDLLGNATQLKGGFSDSKRISEFSNEFIQANISLVDGMSGGPLTDECGVVVGVNTITVGGISLFIPMNQALDGLRDFSDKDIAKIKVDPAASPEEAVRAFYVFLKARRMEESFNLLSREYLMKTDFEEWSSRFVNVIDVVVFKTERHDTEEEKDVVFIKFMTKNWVNGEVERNFYEGTWKTVPEDDTNKLIKSNIKEITEPDYPWFYLY